MLTLVSLGTLLLAGVISWLVAGRILRPVRQVQEAAAEITEHDLTRRITVGDDDVSGLAATFNRMLDRLEEAFRAEQRFVDDAGHELRTPITVIRGHLELMDDDPASREVTMRIVTQELDRMSRIVTDLLALAKADRPDFVRLGEEVDLPTLTISLEAKVSALADRSWRLAHVAEGTARIDTQRVTQAVLQLAHNAVQHTADGDAITLSSDVVVDPELGPALTISVADTGPGVPVAEREHIFERFAHGEPPDGRRHSGAGLGLSIVRAIAEGHGGRVDVGDGRQAWALASTGAFDLLVLDVGLPGLDGFEVLRRLRGDDVDLPVIILTARDRVDDTVAGLEGGANDYMTKPFQFAELLARVRLRLREGGAAPADDGALVAGDLSLDVRRRTARVAGREVELTAREFSLLEAFVEHVEQVLSREQLLGMVWDMDFDPGSNVVDVFVRSLRAKIGAERITTVRGVGYRLRAEARGGAGDAAARD